MPHTVLGTEGDSNVGEALALAYRSSPGCVLGVQGCYSHEQDGKVRAGGWGRRDLVTKKQT